MSTPYSCILFDLDGTIVDSAPGITSTLAYMFERLGLPIPTPSELLTYVGPPLLDSFRDYAGFDAAQSAVALEIYREKYLNVGAYDATQYPGVGLVLKAVHESPIPMSLATSKPETPATLILEHFNLARYFDIITGASDDEVRSAKKDVVAEALIRLAAMGADVSRPVLVGDREHDVHGAAANNVPTIFVEWGYGSVAEQAGAIATVSTPEELQRLLLG
ncbi:phosphoglycolate phosphatase [Conyzicola lurida]|uniref:Phosphoglycolate phosphatase n=1 Tax=Conyzicola lurida TaxID=1172621 RepID=A0A841ANV3_9MICO|nr:HAD hydrolase-like protein [Conyzicola lurida]MBB5844877.1 phosphoglycolate phosphatase [Conyzicola lurida]